MGHRLVSWCFRGFSTHSRGCLGEATLVFRGLGFIGYGFKV